MFVCMSAARVAVVDARFWKVVVLAGFFVRIIPLEVSQMNDGCHKLGTLCH